MLDNLPRNTVPEAIEPVPPSTTAPIVVSLTAVFKSPEAETAVASETPSTYKLILLPS